MKTLNEILLSPENMEICEKIRMVRQSKGYTQDYVAERLSLDTVNYGRIERNQAKLTVDRLFQICKILDIEAASLFQTAVPEKKENNILFEKIYKEVQEINKKLSS